MNRYFSAVLVIVTLSGATTAFAAPPARDSAERPCAHCNMHGARAATRGALYGSTAQFCRHQVASAVRWGVAKKPCPHCTHSA